MLYKNTLYRVHIERLQCSTGMHRFHSLYEECQIMCLSLNLSIYQVYVTNWKVLELFWLFDSTFELLLYRWVYGGIIQI